MGSNYFCFFICIICPFVLFTVNADKRTERSERCNSICKGMKFAGNIGGCKCTVVLFTKRSSELSRSMETEVDTLKQLRHQILGKMDLNTEYELEDESAAEKQEKPMNRLIRLIENRILRPATNDVDY